MKLIAPNTPHERLDREILALETLNHPNIARLEHYLYESKNGKLRHHMVEQFIHGSDLEEIMRGSLPWDLPRVKDFLSQVASSLEALDDQNIVHRDLKPTNIRITPEGCPVIIDFGLARLLDQPDLTATSAGAAIGTPLYFSPEQFSGEKRDIDCRTDLFALGIIVHQLTTGSHPFYNNGMSRGELKDAVCKSDTFASRPEFLALPQPWQLLITRLLQKQRVHRPKNAKHLSLMISKLDEGQ